jgi:uncharacterized protein YbjT (DUF2867 family)
LRHVVAALIAFTAASAFAREDVLILGGAGKHGSAVAKMLLDRGDRVAVLVRPTTKRDRLAGLPVEYVVADAMKADEVAAALQGKRYSVIFETIQVYPGTDQSYSKLYEAVVPVAKRMGVKQFLGLGGGCGDKPAKDCPLSPPLHALSLDMAGAERILIESGVPYTIIRIGALLPTNPNHPAAGMASGKSYLTTDLNVFGGVLRADLNREIVGCIGAARCINTIFMVDDPTVKPQLEHFLCKRRHETDRVKTFHPECGDMPPITEAQLKGAP